MPRIDRLERHLPLTKAAHRADPSAPIGQKGGLFCGTEGGWLDALDPELGLEFAAPFGEARDDNPKPLMVSVTGALWWTEGAPRVPAATLATPVLSDEATIAGILDARVSIAQLDPSDLP
jgi:hypothetical protein